MVESKRCQRCCKAKPLEEFRNPNGTKREFGNLCHPCREIVNRRYRDNYASGKWKDYSQQREYREALFAQPLPEGMKRCTSCLNVRPLVEFARDQKYGLDAPGDPAHVCRQCRERSRLAAVARRKKRTEDKWESERRRMNGINRKLKQRCFDHYGQLCVCCGETTWEFLTFDHVNDDGAHHRRIIGVAEIARWLIRHKFPDTIQVLCWNCQWGKRLGHGVCPHQRVREEALVHG